jgi:hypothetical protein
MNFSIAFFFRIQFHFGVRDLGLALIKSYPPINEIHRANGKTFLYPLYALEPDEFQRTTGIAHFGHQSFSPFFAYGSYADQPCRYLYVFCGGVDIADEIDFGFIDMAVGKMFQQVFPGEDGKFFFQEIAALRADALYVFDGVGQYGKGVADIKIFETNLGGMGDMGCEVLTADTQAFFPGSISTSPNP